MQVEILEGLFDELDKVAARKRSAGFMQSRTGTRPYRVSTLVGRDSGDIPQRPGTTTSYQHPLSKPDSVAQDTENEQASPPSMDEETEKEAGKRESRTDRALSAFAKARPYAVGAVKAGVPAAVLGGIMGASKTGVRGAHSARVFGALGAGAGVANQAIKDWAERHKRKKISKELLEN
jgi:hypothetical protein